MSTNDLEQRAIHNGIDMPALRKTLREFSSDAIAAGPGPAAGVHEFGVFYVQALIERFVMRDGKVFKVDARNVLKLRPATGTTDELTESDDVQFAWAYTPPSSSVYVFKSTTRSGNFTTIAPGGDTGQNFKLVRDTFHNEQSLVMCRNDVSDVDLQLTDAQRWATSPDELLALRIDFNLQSITDGPNIGLNKQTVAAAFNVKIDSGATVPAEPTTTGGREAIAWVRQRAIDISER